MSREVLRIYVRDLELFLAEGWQASQDADGLIPFVDTGTGPNCYVWRELGPPSIDQTPFHSLPTVIL